MISGPGVPPEPSAGSIRELVRTGRFVEALAAFRAAETSLGGRHPELHLLAATAAARLGDFVAAQALASVALDAFRTRADRDGRMRALNLLGVIGFELGRMSDAQVAFTSALELARELTDTQIQARVSNNLASVNHLQGRATDALSLYRGALLSYQRLGDRRGAAETCHNLGIAYRQLAAWPEADASAAEALRHAELVGEPALLSLVLTGRAELRVELGEFALALQELERAERLARDSGDEVGRAEVQRIRALAALRAGDMPTAIREATAAYELARSREVVLLRADSAALLALAHRRSGNMDEAERRRTEALDAYDSLGAEGLRGRLEREWATADRRHSRP
jgi:tetratricopeptide (TPR) repeat protein